MTERRSTSTLRPLSNVDKACILCDSFCFFSSFFSFWFSSGCSGCSGSSATSSFFSSCSWIALSRPHLFRSLLPAVDPLRQHVALVSSFLR